MQIPQQAVFCHKCGKPFKEMQQFCGQCGTGRFSAVPPMAAPPMPAMNAPPPMAAPPAPAMNAPPPISAPPMPAMNTAPPLAAPPMPAMNAPPPMAAPPMPAMNAPPPMATPPMPAIDAPPPMATPPMPAIDAPPPEKPMPQVPIPLMRTVSIPTAAVPRREGETPTAYKVLAISDILIGFSVLLSGILSLMNNFEPLIFLLNFCLGGITLAAGIVCAIQIFNAHLRLARWVKNSALVCAGIHVLRLILVFIINIV